ncbi:MAG: cytochrome b/b6 domain-containing protein [Oceanospirillales bacterium]|jgi:cytochrome b|uniref:cytochrome b/b6 domain-containing protein n=1 Tax=Marinobacter maritimus TaxID=277961 RepID=UPI000BDC0F92|nr:cytochrome b/b6 domain-containing protein [Marinobacter maritimus]MBL1273835.1 cytochrome b/b6 domain-containing protein [Oceanospirillales bacterium]|tara:strand:- start:168 stop:851 length:684 start_codon:yes stop_codon:yes gene_type:complete
MKFISLWDLPTRLFHWLLVLAVSGSLITVNLGGTWMLWHERFGLTIVSLISFRLVWGFVGSTYARFPQFIPGPTRISAYLKGDWQGLGHNPLGALSVLAMLGLLGFQAVTGLFATDAIAFNGPLYRAVSSDWNDTITSWHKLTEWFIYGLIGLHIASVVFYTLVKKNNLITPMVSGRKQVNESTDDQRKGGGLIALIVALGVAGFAVWVANGGLLPPPPPPPPDLGW